MALSSIPKMICITGGSASGKSTYARRLQSLMGNDKCCILAQDHYYFDTPPHETNRNFDHPTAIDFDLMYEHLCLLDQGICPAVPVYDFKTHRRTNKVRLIAPRPLILLDGTLILTHEGIRNRMDYCIFIDVPEHIRFERRLRRDIRERGRTETSVREQFRTQVQPMHEIYIDPMKVFANYIIQNDESFELSLWKMAKLLSQDESSLEKNTFVQPNL